MIVKVSDTFNKNPEGTEQPKIPYFKDNFPPLFYCIDYYVLAVDYFSFSEQNKERKWIKNALNPELENDDIGFSVEEREFVTKYRDKYFFPVYQVRNYSTDSTDFCLYLIKNKMGFHRYVQAFNPRTRQGYFPVNEALNTLHLIKEGKL